VTAIRAFVDSDHSLVVWKLDAPIQDCLGFALKRRTADAPANEEVLDTWVGFAGDTSPPGTKRPSSDWPIQRFIWSDYNPPRDKAVSYQAVPMLGSKGDLREDAHQATVWSDPVTVSADVGDGLSAYFNRGIVATQWLTRELRDRGAENRTTLTDLIKAPGERVRNFLGGAVLWRLPRLLDETRQSGGEIHAALFELNDPQLLEALAAFGARAHVVLANGSKLPDENADARQTLKDAGVEVHDRIVSQSHFAHNKFLVVSGANGPSAVWTGSTNWTITGLCTQSNNALLVENAELAGRYLQEWQTLRDAGNDYPDVLFTENGQSRTVDLGGDAGGAQVWFAPVRNTVDLQSARERINAARDGILFLMFNPGPAGTLLNDIIERTTPASATYDPNLHVHGVLNQDPSTTAHPVVGLFHRGDLTEADVDVVLPAAVDSDFAFWLKELNYSLVMVHSKCIVLDPFGAKPVVMTGSHNMGPKASGKNDDNLLLIDDAPKLAEAYAVYIMGVYNQYRWRYYQREAARGALPATDAHADAAPTWAGLVDDGSWQTKYFTAGGPEQRELNFWLHEPLRKELLVNAKSSSKAEAPKPR
jgi:phosphatidylserine/phosphatidylglycerophosphate/cardiolipin synthase-like enzyme